MRGKTCPPRSKAAPCPVPQLLPLFVLHEIDPVRVSPATGKDSRRSDGGFLYSAMHPGA